MLVKGTLRWAILICRPFYCITFWMMSYKPPPASGTVSSGYMWELPSFVLSEWCLLEMEVHQQDLSSDSFVGAGKEWLWDGSGQTLSLSPLSLSCLHRLTSFCFEITSCEKLRRNDMVCIPPPPPSPSHPPLPTKTFNSNLSSSSFQVCLHTHINYRE